MSLQMAKGKTPRKRRPTEWWLRPRTLALVGWVRAIVGVISLLGPVASYIANQSQEYAANRMLERSRAGARYHAALARADVELGEAIEALNKKIQDDLDAHPK